MGGFQLVSFLKPKGGTLKKDYVIGKGIARGIGTGSPEDLPRNDPT